MAKGGTDGTGVQVTVRVTPAVSLVVYGSRGLCEPPAAAEHDEPSVSMTRGQGHRLLAGRSSGAVTVFGLIQSQC